MILGLALTLIAGWHAVKGKASWWLRTLPLAAVPASNTQRRLRNELFMDTRVTTYLETLDIDVMQSSALFHLLANGKSAAI